MEVTMSVMPAVALPVSPAAGPLRLTRRGRAVVAAVVAAAAALLMAVLTFAATGTAQATNRLPSTGSPDSQNLAQVVVGPGESLWSVAESADPGQDTRLVIQQIIELNALTGYVIVVGQHLWVPRG
jgi:LysM domain